MAFALSFSLILFYGICAWPREPRDRTTIRITLLGDSLLHMPYKNFGLSGKLSALMPKYNVEVFDEGVNGNKILDIRNRLSGALRHSSNFIVLFWDTDCSDVSEVAMSSADVSQLRASYLQNVRFVVNTTLQNSGPNLKKLLMMGPGLLGEGLIEIGLGHEEKNAMLDTYRFINKQVLRAGSDGMNIMVTI